jgi:hypothetical protein
VLDDLFPPYPFRLFRNKYRDNNQIYLQDRDRMWTGFNRLRMRWMEGCFEQDNENFRVLDLRSRNVVPYKKTENVRKTCNVTLRRFGATTVLVEKQRVLHIVSVSL